MSWPALIPEPWTSLQDLHIDIRICHAQTFEDVDFHNSFPNLKKLKVSRTPIAPVVLPDLTECDCLEDVTLSGPNFFFKYDLAEKVES